MSQMAFIPRLGSSRISAVPSLSVKNLGKDDDNDYDDDDDDVHLLAQTPVF
jgi:hypothetical protein